MKVLITGANGMLGKDLCYFLDEIGCFIIPTNKEIMDITNNQIVDNVISKTKPDLIIHKKKKNRQKKLILMVLKI